MLYPAELCRHTIFGLKSRFFSLFDHPDRWPIFSIFSRYFFRRKCYLRPLQHLAFLIKILSTELPSTPEYFSKVLSTGPPLGVRLQIESKSNGLSSGRRAAMHKTVRPTAYSGTLCGVPQCFGCDPWSGNMPHQKLAAEYSGFYKKDLKFSLQASSYFDNSSDSTSDC